MTLLNPWGLLALLSLPAIVWLHFYVMHGPRQVVSSLHLWLDDDQLQSEGKQRQKPPLSWVLLLELLAALCFSLALAGLDFPQTGAQREHLGIVIDRSASMQGGPSGQTAYAEIIPRLETYLQDRDARLSVIVSGERPVLLGGKPLTLEEARYFLDRLTPDQPHHSLTPALELLASFVPDAANTLIFTDNPEFGYTRPVHIGQPAFNAGIIAANWPADEQPFIVVRAFTEPPGPLSLMMSDGNKTVEIPLALSTAGEIPLTLTPPANAKRIELTLPSDGLAADNRVVLIPPPQRTLALHVAHDSPMVINAFARLIQALPNLTRGDFSSADVIISDGNAISNSAFNVLLLDAADDSQLRRDWQFDAFSPLLAGFDPFGLIWYAVDKPKLANGAVHLQADGASLIQLDENLLIFNIDLQRSNLFRHSAFPVIFQNLVAWLDEQKGGLQRYHYAQGESLSITRAANWQGDVNIQTPDGSTTTYIDNPLRLGQLVQAGIYTLSTDNHREDFAVNFLDAREGALHLRKPENQLPPLAFAEVIDTESSQLTRRLLILLAVLCVLGAWVLLAPQRRLTLART